MMAWGKPESCDEFRQQLSGFFCVHNTEVGDKCKCEMHVKKQEKNFRSILCEYYNKISS